MALLNLSAAKVVENLDKIDSSKNTIEEYVIYDITNLKELWRTTERPDISNLDDNEDFMPAWMFDKEF